MGACVTAMLDYSMAVLVCKAPATHFSLLSCCGVRGRLPLGLSGGGDDAKTYVGADPSQRHRDTKPAAPPGKPTGDAARHRQDQESEADGEIAPHEPELAPVAVRPPGRIQGDAYHRGRAEDVEEDHPDEPGARHEHALARRPRQRREG